MDTGQASRLKVINLWGEPGAGKSTTAAGLFNLLKLRGEKVELVTEAAKDFTYQGDLSALSNQLYLLGCQDFRLSRLQGEVDWAITDSPLPLVLAYATAEFQPWLDQAVKGAWRRYTNFNFRIDRVKPYALYGRRQSEHEAYSLGLCIEALFQEFVGGDPRLRVDGDERAPREIAAKIGLWDGLDP
jgi:ABC-type dipeptide/oligopeptide/nickel transport system ATPase component